MKDPVINEVLTEMYHPVYRRTFQYGRDENRIMHVRSRASMVDDWSEWIPYKIYRRESRLEKYGLPKILSDN